MDETFEFGNPKVNAAGFQCCGQPQGCGMTHDGCAYLRHPWKRAMALHELVCWLCGSEVATARALCTECLRRWECPGCGVSVPRSYLACHLCAAVKPEGAIYA